MGKIEPFNDAEIAEWLERAKRAGVGAFENILRFKARYDAAEAKVSILQAANDNIAAALHEVEDQRDALQAVVDKLVPAFETVQPVYASQITMDGPAALMPIKVYEMVAELLASHPATEDECQP